MRKKTFALASPPSCPTKNAKTSRWATTKTSQRKRRKPTIDSRTAAGNGNKSFRNFSAAFCPPAAKSLFLKISFLWTEIGRAERRQLLRLLRRVRANDREDFQDRPSQQLRPRLGRFHSTVEWFRFNICVCYGQFGCLYFFSLIA